MIPRDNLIYREAIFCLFDNTRDDFIGNSVRIRADYDKDYEDEWRFNTNKKDNENVL